MLDAGGGWGKCINFYLHQVPPLFPHHTTRQLRVLGIKEQAELQAGASSVVLVCGSWKYSSNCSFNKETLTAIRRSMIYITMLNSTLRMNEYPCLGMPLFEWNGKLWFLWEKDMLLIPILTLEKYFSFKFKKS